MNTYCVTYTYGHPGYAPTQANDIQFANSEQEAVDKVRSKFNYGNYIVNIIKVQKQ